MVHRNAETHSPQSKTTHSTRFLCGRTSNAHDFVLRLRVWIPCEILNNEPFFSPPLPIVLFTTLIVQYYSFWSIIEMCKIFFPANYSRVYSTGRLLINVRCVSFLFSFENYLPLIMLVLVNSMSVWAPSRRIIQTKLCTPFQIVVVHNIHDRHTIYNNIHHGRMDEPRTDHEGRDLMIDGRSNLPSLSQCPWVQRSGQMHHAWIDGLSL